MDILNSCCLSYTSSPFRFSTGMAPGLTRGDAFPPSHSPAFASVPMYSPSCRSLAHSVAHLLTSDSSSHFSHTFIPVLHFYCCGKDREPKQRGEKGPVSAYSFSSSWREVRAGAWTQEPTQRPQRGLVPHGFLIHPRDGNTHSRVGGPSHVSH